MHYDHYKVLVTAMPDPQGSVLSSMLFNIYMKQLSGVIWSFGVRCHQYADDTLLYFSFLTSAGEAVGVLNWCLATIMDWMRANKLKFNPDKTELLLVGDSSAQMGGVQTALDRVTLPLKEQVCSLGCSLIHLCHLRLRWHWWLTVFPASFSWWPSCVSIRTRIAWLQQFMLWPSLD